jgi:adenylyltransferase/sulfurtransferase
MLHKSNPIAIIGLGSLGSMITMDLIKNKFNNIIIIDRDFIEEKNIQNQKLYSKKDIGNLKSETAKNKLLGLNKDIKIKSYNLDLNYKTINILKKVNLIIDCTDNLETRFLINEFSKRYRIPWIYSSITGKKGMVYTITKNSPCFNCIFKEPTEHLGTCETYGINKKILKKISNIQLQEVLNLTKNNETKKLLNYNLKTGMTKIKVYKNKNCSVCKGKYKYITGEKRTEAIKLCGTNSFQIETKNLNTKKLKEELLKIDKIKNFKTHFIFRNIFIFNNKVIIRAKTKEEAKSIYDKYLG